MPLVKPPAGRWVNAYDLASQWLTSLGWPNTAGNQRALAAWFMAESKRSGNNVYVVGNNPLNITTSSGNYRLVGTHKIAVYDNPIAGTTAFSNLIDNPGHNYPGIVKAFKFGGNPIAAIINSGWVTGGVGPSYWHTVSGHRSNLLQSIFDGISPGHSTSTGGGIIPTGPSDLPNPLTIDYWLFILKHEGISTAPNYKLTKADATKIMADLFPGYTDAAGTKNAITSFTGENVFQAFPLAARLVGEHAIGNTPAVSGPLDPGKAIGDAVAAILGTIAPILAILGGGVLSLFGIYLITKEATSTTGAGESLVSPVPIFLRKGA